MINSIISWRIVSLFITWRAEGLEGDYQWHNPEKLDDFGSLSDTAY